MLKERNSQGGISIECISFFPVNMLQMLLVVTWQFYHTIPTVKFRGEKIVAWGIFPSRGGPGRLHKIEGAMYGAMYWEILDMDQLPSTRMMRMMPQSHLSSVGNQWIHTRSVWKLSLQRNYFSLSIKWVSGLNVVISFQVWIIWVITNVWKKFPMNCIFGNVCTVLRKKLMRSILISPTVCFQGKKYIKALM